MGQILLADAMADWHTLCSDKVNCGVVASRGKGDNMAISRPGLSVLTLLALCLSIIPFLARATEPSYDGKPLSDWLLLNLAGKDEARDAILQLS